MKNLISTFAIVSFVVSFSLFVAATPAQILIIRHGEKPDTGADLSPIGEKRAAALVRFFTTDPSVTEFGTPVAIYAAEPQSEGSSMRPIETVTPLAEALGIKINTVYTKSHPKKLVADILNSPGYDGKTVLICWVHDAIPAIVKALGVKPVPDEWPSAEFDRVWKINFVNGNPSSVIDLPQHVLPGDSLN
jgi:hypothetical protein